MLELPKLRSRPDDGDEPRLAAWCSFFSAETDEQLEALAMQHPIIKEAKSALDEISADELARIQAVRREDELYFYEHGLHLSRERGREQGREEGREQGREEGARLQSRSILTRVIQLKLGSVPPALQARIDGGNKDELEAWIDAALTADSIDDAFR